MTSAVQPREERTAAGVALMALAGVFFIGTDTSAKWLTLAGLPVLQIVFARYAGHLVYAGLIYLPRQGLSVLGSHAPRRQALRSCLLLSSTILNFAALTYLPITVTTTINFAMPIVVTLLAIPVLGERVGLRRLAAVCVGFIGVLVVVQPWGVQFHPAMLLSLANLAVASGYFVMTRMLAGVEANATQQLWSSGLATLVLAPFALWVWTWPEGPVEWAVLCGIGGFGALGHIFATTAHRLADASILSPLVYTQIILAALAGIVVFGTWPTVWTLVGGAIIVGSGLYIWQRERRLGRAPRVG